MKKVTFLIFTLLLSASSYGQNFQSHFKDGLYKFDDTMKIQASEVFSSYSSQFSFSSGDGMVLSNSRLLSDGLNIDKYVQYHDGYPINGTMMNVISKHGIALYVNGFYI